MSNSKVLAYIIKNNKLLVFDHVKFPEVSPQVIKGSVDSDEDLKEAIVREIYEESGLKLKCSPNFIGSFRLDDHPITHVFIFRPSEELPDEWEHIVSDGVEDKGFVFKFYWLPVEEAKNKLVSNMGAYLDSFSV